MKSAKKVFGRCLLSTMGLVLLAGVISSMGCTVHTNGMTIPSPDWMGQRVQYMPAGPQFPLSQEAAYMDAAKAEKK